jgi:hypothetical protein
MAAKSFPTGVSVARGPVITPGAAVHVIAIHVTAMHVTAIWGAPRHTAPQDPRRRLDAASMPRGMVAEPASHIRERSGMAEAKPRLGRWRIDVQRVPGVRRTRRQPRRLVT